MSFIDDSENNINRLMETSAAGGVGGFVGTGGTRIDTLFAGGFHPDYGEIDKLHKQNLKSRKKRDSEEYGGESPVGGYYGGWGAQKGAGKGVTSAEPGAEPGEGEGEEEEEKAKKGQWR